MGECTYCGESAGFFKKLHPECDSKYQNGKHKIFQLLKESIENQNFTDELRNSIISIAKSSFLDYKEKQLLTLSAWESMVNKFLEDSAISPDEETKLEKYTEFFGIKEEMKSSTKYMQLIKGAILYELTEGKIPQRISLKGSVPINIDKDEEIIWVFQHTSLYQEKTKRHYEGGSRGVSVKIMKGVYYRTSSFKGYPIDTTYLQQIDNGMLVVTNKKIYFTSQAKTIKIPFNKISATYPYDDGIMIHRDVASKQSLIFITNDGWFTNNLVENLINFESKGE